MALKYLIEYQDVHNEAHRVEIYDDSYTGDPIEVNGTVFLDYSQTREPLEAIRGSGLRVQLDADQTQDFSDLDTEEERTFRVTYKRNNIILFEGWINPEGWFEDWVKDKWQVSFDCTDGLGFLENLAFVFNDTGLQILDKRRQSQLLALALERTGLKQNINIDIRIFYTGLAETNDPLYNVYTRSERFIKDDGETIMSCEEVIRDILEPYGAIVISINGEWLVCKPNQLYFDGTINYFKYDYLGEPLTPAKSTLNTSFILGSDVNNFFPHHARSNQRIENKRSLGAYRINYKYGVANSFNDNPYFISTDNVTLNDWDIITQGSMSFPGKGIGYVAVPTPTAEIRTEISGLELDFRLKVTIKVSAVIPSGAPFSGNFRYRMISSNLEITNPARIEYQLVNNSWDMRPPHINTFELQGQEMTKEIVTFGLPQDGFVYLIILGPDSNDPPGIGFDVSLKEVSITEWESEEEGSVVEGEFHTFQRTNKPSTFVDDEVKPVFTGDNPSDIYVGTLYKTDDTTPTETWFRGGFTEAKPLLQIMGEEIMRMSQKTARVFSGTVLGYFSYLSTVSIDGIAGKFIPTKYSYNSVKDEISVELTQILADEVTDIEYTRSLDYGNVVKPTIKG